MKIILQENVIKLGNAGDVVEASPGYFRNYLQPKRLAVVATEGALKKRQEDLQALNRKAEKAHQEALAVAKRIDEIGKLSLSARVGEGGKLYGKITNKEIAQAIGARLQIEIDKRLIKVGEEINALGSYKITIKQAADVQSVITLDVVPEGIQEAGEGKEVKVAAAREKANTAELQADAQD